jgi:hypothetical protein
MEISYACQPPPTTLHLEYTRKPRPESVSVRLKMLVGVSSWACSGPDAGSSPVEAHCQVLADAGKAQVGPGGGARRDQWPGCSSGSAGRRAGW